MLLGLRLDNIFTVKCWLSCLIIAQYFSSLLGNYHYHADQADRPAYGDARAWHFTLTGRCLSLSSTSKHCVHISVTAITDTGNFVESCLCLVTGWRPLLHDCCSRGTVTRPSQSGVIWSLSACSLPLRLPAAHPDYKEWLSAGCYLWAAAEKQYCNLILHE